VRVPEDVGDGEARVTLSFDEWIGGGIVVVLDLADALEDSGCTDAVMLGHLRGAGPHFRWCFALILGII